MSRIPKSSCVVLITVMSVMLMASEKAPAEKKPPREYRLPGHGLLELAVPQSWTDEVRQPPFGLPPTIIIRSAGGDNSQLMITPLWSPRGEDNFNSDSKVREMVEREMQSMQATAAEKELVLKPIKGPEANGYYYMATDKAPKPGEWEYALRAGVACGELLISGTLLTHDKGSPAVSATLEMFRTAKQVSEATLRAMGKVDDRYPPKLPDEGEYSPPTQEQKMWALATHALITEHNRARHDLLGGYERTPEHVQERRIGLAEGWDVQNRDGLLKTLRWIEAGGHRKDFDLMQKYIKVLPSDERAIFLGQLRANPEMNNKLHVISYYQHVYGDKSIVAWDYARYTVLCGWGYVAGYFSEEEAWRRMMPAARLLQQTFDSWRALGTNYLIGREFWSLEETRSGGESMQKAFHRLCTDSDSPWKTIPWNLDLTPQKKTQAPAGRTSSL